jgi:hypothetical protein
MFCSLCGQVMPVIAAAVEPEPVPDEAVVTKRLSVPENPKRYVWGVAYPSERADGHHEWMSADELERTAWDFCRKGRRIGFYHADGTMGHGTVVETGIWRGPDWETTDIYGNSQVIKTNDWTMGIELDSIGFEQVVGENADGLSMDGVTKRRIRRLPTGDN